MAVWYVTLVMNSRFDFYFSFFSLLKANPAMKMEIRMILRIAYSFAKWLSD